MPHPRQLLVVRFEENTQLNGWKLYLGCREPGKIDVCAQKGDNGSSLTFKVKEGACKFFVENLLWDSSVETSLLVVSELALMRGFDALERARAGHQAHRLLTFDGDLSRADIEEYIKQVCDVSVDV